MTAPPLLETKGALFKGPTRGREARLFREFRAFQRPLESPGSSLKDQRAQLTFKGLLCTSEGPLIDQKGSQVDQESSRARQKGPQAGQKGLRVD